MDTGTFIYARYREEDQCTYLYVCLCACVGIRMIRYARWLIPFHRQAPSSPDLSPCLASSILPIRLFFLLESLSGFYTRKISVYSQNNKLSVHLSRRDTLSRFAFSFQRKEARLRDRPFLYTLRHGGDFRSWRRKECRARLPAARGD